jgi:cytidine deaminase
VISYGTNQIREKPIHAERDAISSLKQRKKKKLKKVNILVIKASKTGIYGNSKPCYHCIMDMKNYTETFGYKIDNVYYTNCEGNIENKKLKTLLIEKQFHFSSYYKYLNDKNNEAKSMPLFDRQ